MHKKDRIEIPATLAAEVLFRSNRTCCVCRIRSKPVQIHHIDDNPANNTFANLAILCFDCHTDTQIRGGFHRKLDAEQVILFRDDWLVLVARKRTSNASRHPGYDEQTRSISVEVATSVAEIYRERGEYELLAVHYASIGNKELRDKYIELTINDGVDDFTLIFLRGLQNRIDLVPRKAITRCIKRMEEAGDWSQLGRVYRTIGDHEAAAKVTCKGIAESIDKGNTFGAAFYLKELFTEGTVEELFKIAFEEARQEKDLWWQYRALQELEWNTEAKEFLLEHQDEIEASGNTFLDMDLALALNNRERYIELRKEEAQYTSRAKFVVVPISMTSASKTKRSAKLTTVITLGANTPSSSKRFRRIPTKQSGNRTEEHKL